MAGCSLPRVALVREAEGLRVDRGGAQSCDKMQTFLSAHGPLQRFWFSASAGGCRV